MTVTSPMCTGNGAYVVHKALERRIPKYRVLPYNPYWTLFPPVLPVFTDPGARIIHTTPDYAIFLVPTRARLVLTFHNYVLDPAMGPYSSTLQRAHYQTDLRLFMKLAVRRAHRVTAVSKATADLARRDLRYSGRIEVIANGVDTHTFRPPSSRVPSPRLRVLFCGNPTRRKGIQWLPAILDQINDSVIIHLTGGLRKKEAALSHPRLRHIRSVPHSAMPALYQSMDVLLMPTVREGMSLAVLEAMASGLPVVASDISSLPEQVHHGRGGFLCPVGDAHAFAQALNALADDPMLKREMGDYNRARAESAFSESRMAAAYQSVFDVLAG